MRGKRNRFRRRDVPTRAYAEIVRINSCDFAATLDAGAGSGNLAMALQTMEFRAIRIQPS